MSEEPIAADVRAMAGGLFEALLSIGAGVQQSRRAPTGAVTSSQLAALRVLAERESCTMQELAAGAGVTSPTMTSTVKLLIKKGLVDRRHGEDDWRTVRISITPQGREAQHEAQDTRMLAFARAVQSLPPEQRAMLMVALPSLRALAAAVNSTA